MSSGTSKVIPVSELFNRLAAEYRNAGIPQAQLFQTALRVCGDDSKRIRRGEAPAEIGALVEEARAILEVSHPRATHPSLGGRQVETLAPDRSTRQVPPQTDHEERPAATAAPVAPPAPPVPPPPSPAQTPFEPENAAPAAAAPFDVHLEHAAAAPDACEAPISFEDVFRHEEEPEAGPERPHGGGRPFSVLRVGMVALAVLAAAVVVVILWPGLMRSRSASPARQAASPAADAGTRERPRAAAGTSAPAPPATAPAPAAAVPVPPAQAAPVATEASPAAAEKAPAPVRPAPAAAAPVQPEVVEGVETMRSADWAGRAPEFVVHFASYRSRDNANADAARLAHDLGRPAYVLRVDLGDKGEWYRVVVGGFATAAEARTFRARVAEAKTRDVGGVYRVAAP